MSSFVIATLAVVEAGYDALLTAVDHYVLQTTSGLEQIDPESAQAMNAQYATQRLRY